LFPFLLYSCSRFCCTPIPIFTVFLLPGNTIDKVYGFDQIAHSGYTAGYRAWLAWYPQKQLSVVLLSNFAAFYPEDFGRRIAAIFLGQDPQQQTAQAPPAVPAVYEGKISETREADLAEFAGNYYSPDIETIYRLFVLDGQLKVCRRAEDVFTLQHLSGDFFTSVGNGEFQFERNRKGRVTGFKVSVSRAENVPFDLVTAGFKP